jgi:hypothetical protein
MKWRKLSMARDDAEMTTCGRGVIRRKDGTSTMWRARVKINNQTYSSYSNFTKKRAKRWVENKIRELERAKRRNNGAHEKDVRER